MCRIQEKSNKIQNNERGMTQSLQESLLLVKRVREGLNWSRGFSFVCVSKHTLDLVIPCLLFWILLDYFPWILYIVLHPAFNKLHLKISLMLQRFPSSPCVCLSLAWMGRCSCESLYYLRWFLLQRIGTCVFLLTIRYPGVANLRI